MVLSLFPFGICGNDILDFENCEFFIFSSFASCDIHLHESVLAYSRQSVFFTISFQEATSSGESNADSAVDNENGEKRTRRVIVTSFLWIIIIRANRRVASRAIWPVPPILGASFFKVNV